MADPTTTGGTAAQSSLAQLQQLTLPPLTINGPITADGKTPSSLFQRQWINVLTAIQGAIDNLETQVNNIEGILNGTIPFTGINASGNQVIDFLANNTNGSAISNPAGLSANVVTTPSVAGGAITAPISLTANPNYVIATNGVFYNLPGCTITQPFDGGDVEINGRVTLTHSVTTTALYTLKVTRTSSPSGATPYSDQATFFIPGVNGNYIDFTYFFRDNNLGTVAGNATYTFSAEVNGSSGGGYTQTTSTLLAESRNYKK